MPRRQSSKLEEKNCILLDKNELLDIASTNRWGEIRDIISGFLGRCNSPCSSGRSYSGFEATCWDEVYRRGYDVGAIGPYMQPSIAIAALAYAHVRNTKARVFIALYTAFAMWVDNACGEELKSFHGCLMSKHPQKSKSLEDLAAILPEALDYWGPVASGLIYSAMIDFITAVLVDTEIADMEVHDVAGEFVDLMRVLSGLGQAYTAFIFPPDIPVTSYIQAMPAITIFINHTNDILSFYKEEVMNDTPNYISLKAEHHRTSRVESLRMLADSTADAHERASRILQRNKEAYDAFIAYSRGYVAYHFCSTRRYRLDELEL